MQEKIPEDGIAAQIQKMQAPLKGRRVLSWILFISLISLFLIVPIAASILPDWSSSSNAQAESQTGLKAESKPASGQPALPHAAPLRTNSTLMALDLTWNPGQIASSHQPWANDCKVCHSTPFAQVKDADCLACHRDTTDHVEKKVSAFSDLHEMRCATCHRDHQGDFGLVSQNKHYTSQNCADCHVDIKASYPDTQTQDVSDFAKDHPEFRIQHAADADRAKLVRTRLSSSTKLLENTSLKFPHDVHLLPAGVNSPNGKVNMKCADCHQPSADGTGFLPVTMKKDCQSCHDLKFEPAVSNREVPHGPVEDVLTTLREFYSYVGMHNVPVDKPAPDRGLSLIRPGKAERIPSFVHAPGDVKTRAAAAATELFEKTSCVVCHEVTRMPTTGGKGVRLAGMPNWEIAPIVERHAWMPKSAFNHAKHTTAQCVDCHSAPSSKEASEILMPAIETCRDCHAGKQAEANKVTSDCGVCHGFHPPKAQSTAAAGVNLYSARSAK